MRYQNDDDRPEVECYACGDHMPATECAVRRGDAWFCVFCLVDDQEYVLSQGRTPEPLSPKARRLLKAHVARMQAALKYPIGG